MKRVLLFLLMGLILVLAMSGVALAATSSPGTSPLDIYSDWLAHNGTLTVQYTDAQLEAVRNDPTLLMEFDSDALKPLDTYITSLLAKPGRSIFPWTGAQIAAILAAAVLLIGLGVLLRRSAKRKQPDGE